AHAQHAAGVTHGGSGHVAHGRLQAAAEAGAAEERGDARVALSAEDPLGDEPRLVLAVGIDGLGCGLGVAVGGVPLAHLTLFALWRPPGLRPSPWPCSAAG